MDSMVRLVDQRPGRLIPRFPKRYMGTGSAAEFSLGVFLTGVLRFLRLSGVQSEMSCKGQYLWSFAVSLVPWLGGLEDRHVGGDDPTHIGGIVSVETRVIQRTPKDVRGEVGALYAFTNVAHSCRYPVWNVAGGRLASETADWG